MHSAKYQDKKPTKNLVAFLYTNNGQSEKIATHIIQSMTTPKRKKNTQELTNEVKSWDYENNKTLVKETKDINIWNHISHSWFQKILLKCVYYSK